MHIEIQDQNELAFPEISKKGINVKMLCIKAHCYTVIHVCIRYQQTLYHSDILVHVYNTQELVSG